MKTTDVVIAANTIWVAPNGRTHGSPVDPLLRLTPSPSSVWLPPGEARLRRQLEAIHEAIR
jgi:hypothetical protein